MTIILTEGYMPPITTEGTPMPTLRGSGGATTLSEITEQVNHYAGKLLKKYLKAENTSTGAIKVSPFKATARAQQRGNGRISNGINQAEQLHDFESWVSPGNQVINYI